MNNTFRNALCALMMNSALVATAQTNVAVETGSFTPDWQNLAGWECPEWFKDAKFGIWAHWGPQCEAEAGDWYARGMYTDGSGQQNYHYEKYGNPQEFGFKDVINVWKADQWDPDALVSLYKSVGARYFFTLGQHHDNFDLWDSPYQEWNSVNMGPKKDIVRGWSDACKKYGLPLGISMHGSHAWTWYELAQDYDGNLTKADGAGLWWEGYDPQELYAQNHTPSRGYEISSNIHSQWDWANGASLPSEAYKTKFQNRVLEAINTFNPDMLYFDDTVLPFYGCDDEVGLNILSHYYNHSAAQNDGEQQVVVMGKKLQSSHKRAMLWDVERGIPDRPQDDYWQTCTCIGSWHYERSVYDRNGYKSAQQVVDMLVDIVSKNGNLLLSVPIRGNGSIDEKEMAVLEGIKAWMDVNSTSIYGTRPWKNFGEGPLAEASNPLNSQGFNESNNYSSKDVRFVERNDSVFATIMRWPSEGKFTFASFGKLSKYYSGDVKSVSLLGHGDVAFENTIDGLTVDVPANTTGSIAPVFVVTFDETSDTDVSLSEIISLYEKRLEELNAQTSSNTGWWNRRAVSQFAGVVAEAKTALGQGTSAEAHAIRDLATAYAELMENGRNKGTGLEVMNGTDMTVDALMETSNFTASEMGTRFGTPLYWDVENYYVPVQNTAAGVKNGIDAYGGVPALAIGVWSGEDVTDYDSDVANARIYRKVHLEAGRYYFGAAYNAIYQLNEAYIFASTTLANTSELADKAIAYESVSEATQDGTMRGINFTLDEDMDVYLGFQADVKNGSTTQEFRATSVRLIYYGENNSAALDNLISEIDLFTAMAQTGNNTGNYQRKTIETLRDAMEAAMDVIDAGDVTAMSETYDELYEMYNEVLSNGRIPGSAPEEGSGEDVTEEYLVEASGFSTSEVGSRFGTPANWTVDNCYIPVSETAGVKNGYDAYGGVPALALGVWAGEDQPGYYDGAENARIYRMVHLPAGRYYFGAAYNAIYQLGDAYIFASTELTTTDLLPETAFAFESINQAKQDGSMRGITFTLAEDMDVYLGFQADIKNGSPTQEFRATEVRLISYGLVNYAAIEDLLTTIDERLAEIQVNDNTGHYSSEALAELNTTIDAARQLTTSATYDEIAEALQTLNNAWATFVADGRNQGGQPDDIDANDITVATLGEESEFARADASINTRFASPLNWKVDNYNVTSNSEGVRGGLDKYPGYDCLTLGLWDDRGNASDDIDLHNARVYQTVHLTAGRYYFGARFNTIYNLHSAYIFASEGAVATDDIETQSVAWMKISDCSADSNTYGIYFTLTEDADIDLGFQANLADGAGAQEFRVAQVSLFRYGDVADGIDEINASDVNTADDSAPIEYFTISGQRIAKAPAKGMYIMRQGTRSVKIMK